MTNAERRWLLDAAERTRKLNGEKSLVDGLTAAADEIARLKEELDLCHQSMAKMAKMYPVVDAARTVDESATEADLRIVSQPLFIALCTIRKSLRALDGEP